MSEKTSNGNLSKKLNNTQLEERNEDFESQKVIERKAKANPPSVPRLCNRVHAEELVGVRESLNS